MLDQEITTGTESELYFTDFFHISYTGSNTLNEVTPHKHKFYEFIFHLDGNVEYTVEGTTYKQSFGNILLVPPSTLHQAAIMDNKQSYRRYSLWVTQEFVQSLVEYDPSMTYIFQIVDRMDTYCIKIPQEKMNILIHLLTEITQYKHTKEFGHLTKCKSLLHDLFYQLNTALYLDEYYMDNFQKKDIYLQITDYIRENLTEDLSLDQLAEVFFLSKYHMLHIFKEKMSISIHRYIVIRRLEVGKSLILSGSPISKVHTLCGFKDYTTFYRAFRVRYAMSPKQYYKTYSKGYLI